MIPVRYPTFCRYDCSLLTLLLDFAIQLLLHNHPSGDPTPSAADVEMTRQIVAAAKALSVVVHDHLIVGRDGTASLKSLGVM